MRHLTHPILLSALLGGVVASPAEAQPPMTRVSVASGGIQANRTSVGESISANGRWMQIAPVAPTDLSVAAAGVFLTAAWLDAR
jgi:hypothetical protein